MQATRFRPGLRLRVALVLALACLLVSATLGITLYAASEEMEDALVRQILDEEMEFLVQRHRDEPGYVPTQGSNLKSYIVRNAQEQAQVPELIRGFGPGIHEIFVGIEETEVLVREVAGTRYVVAYEVGLHQTRERSFKILVVIAVVVAELAALGLGYWLSGLLVAQITNLARAVGRLHPGEAGEILAHERQDREVATLARALDSYRASMEQMVKREQEFTANASHELRTPLTAIHTSCELLLSDAEVSGKVRERVERIDEAARRIAEQIHALLLLARGQEASRAEAVVLADCAAEVMEPHRQEIARKSLTVEIAIDRDEVIDVDRQALRFVLANLVRNAVTYTERGFVRVGYAARRLTVSDSGEGIGREHLPQIFDRFFRRGKGRRRHRRRAFHRQARLRPLRLAYRGVQQSRNRQHVLHYVPPAESGALARRQIGISPRGSLGAQRGPSLTRSGTEHPLRRVGWGSLPRDRPALHRAREIGELLAL